MSAEARPALLTGWGRTAPTAARLVEGVGATAVADLVRQAGHRGVLARGLGRAYGDAAQNAGGTVVTLDPDAAVSLDPATGLVTAGAGVSLDRLLRELVPRGWFVPVTPGTRFVTVGGAVAADVHGKNHHRDGSFGAHVRHLELVDGEGTLHTLGPDDDPEAFWATVGGMGLTGVIVRATFRALPIATSRMLVDTTRAADLDDCLAQLADADARHRYSVAWIDLLATGRSFGRSVLTCGDHAPLDALDDTTDPLAYDPKVRLAAPPFVPGGLLNRATIRAFNEVWYRKAPTRRLGEVQTIPAFFHPLDGVAGWNRLYGPRGFVQYQVVVPFGAEAVLRHLVERLSAAGAPSFLAVLKRFGAGNPAPLSFPMPGWTLALDVPAGVAHLAALLDDLDRVVVDAGGRTYFAKDARVDPALVPAMYPRIDEWRAVRDRLDPHRRFCSDLARRLHLLG